MIIDTYTTLGPVLASHAKQELQPFDDTETVDGLLAVLDRAGIDRAVVFAPRWVGGDVIDPTYALANEAVHAAAQQHPDRIIGYARVNPNYGADALAEAVRCFDEYGFKGLMLDAEWENFIPSDRELVYPLVSAVRDRGLAVLVECGYAPMSPAVFWELATDFPETPIILAHLGGRLMADALTIVERTDNVYVETSDHMYRLGRYAAQVGAHRILFGSNTPFAAPETELFKVNVREDISAEDKALILGGNAARLNRL